MIRDISTTVRGVAFNSTVQYSTVHRELSFSYLVPFLYNIL